MKTCQRFVAIIRMWSRDQTVGSRRWETPPRGSLSTGSPAGLLKHGRHLLCEWLPTGRIRRGVSQPVCYGGSMYSQAPVTARPVSSCSHAPRCGALRVPRYWNCRSLLLPHVLCQCDCLGLWFSVYHGLCACALACCWLAPGLAWLVQLPVVFTRIY